MLQTRVIRVGEASFQVESNSESAVDIVESIYGHLPCVPASDHRSFLFLTHGSVHYLTIGDNTGTFDNRADAIDRLVTGVNLASLDADADRLHLHVGAVCLDDRAVLVVAPSGGGKTTLTAALASCGWSYLSDEMAALASGDERVHCWPKPLSVKQSGLERFSKITGVQIGRPSDLWSGQVPPRSLGCQVATTADPKLLVFLTADVEPAPILEVSPAAAVVLLAEQTMDFERFGDGSLLTLAELAGRCHAISLPRGDPLQMVASIENEWERAEPSVLQPEVFEFDVALRPDLEAVGLGGEVVVRNRKTGRIAAMNRAAAEELNSHASYVDSRMTTTRLPSEFEQQLMDAGILTQAIDC